MQKLRVLVLMHHYLVPPDDIGDQDPATAQWRTEYDVLTTLRELGHDVLPLGCKDDLGSIRQANVDFKPHIAFNLLEGFHEIGTFDQNVVSYLELLAAVLHRLQSAGHVPGTRQGPFEEAAAVPPHRRPGIHHGRARPEAHGSPRA